MIQAVYLRLTPHAGGQSLTLPAAELERDQAGNLTARWSDAILAGRLLTAADLEGILSTNVDVHRNRAGAVLAVTDPGGVLLEAEWTEYDPWAGSPRGPHALRCVAVHSGSSVGSSEARLALVLYRAQYRYERGTGLVEGD